MNYFCTTRFHANLLYVFQQYYNIIYTKVMSIHSQGNYNHNIQIAKQNETTIKKFMQEIAKNIGEKHMQQKEMLKKSILKQQEEDISNVQQSRLESNKQVGLLAEKSNSQQPIQIIKHQIINTDNGGGNVGDNTPSIQNLQSISNSKQQINPIPINNNNITNNSSKKSLKISETISEYEQQPFVMTMKTKKSEFKIYTDSYYNDSLNYSKDSSYNDLTLTENNLMGKLKIRLGSTENKNKSTSKKNLNSNLQEIRDEEIIIPPQLKFFPTKNQRQQQSNTNVIDNTHNNIQNNNIPLQQATDNNKLEKIKKQVQQLKKKLVKQGPSTQNIQNQQQQQQYEMFYHNNSKEQNDDVKEEQAQYYINNNTNNNSHKNQQITQQEIKMKQQIDDQTFKKLVNYKKSQKQDSSIMMNHIHSKKITNKYLNKFEQIRNRKNTPTSPPTTIHNSSSMIFSTQIQAYKEKILKLEQAKLKKKELEKELELINEEIKEITSQKKLEESQSFGSPGLKKVESMSKNKVKLMINISDDHEAKIKASRLIHKLQMEKKQRQKSLVKEFEKIDAHIIDSISQLSKIREEQDKRIKEKKKIEIINRMKSQERRKIQQKKLKEHSIMFLNSIKPIDNTQNSVIVVPQNQLKTPPVKPKQAIITVATPELNARKQKLQKLRNFHPQTKKSLMQEYNVLLFKN